MFPLVDNNLTLSRAVVQEMSVEEVAEITAEKTAELRKPSITFSKVVFSDETAVDLQDDEIVVFVGPNNAGKSAALRELYDAMGNPTNSRVIKSVEKRQKGNSSEFVAYLDAHSQKVYSNGSQFNYVGLGYSIHFTHTQFFDNNTNGHIITPFFGAMVMTEGRLTGSNPAGPLAIHQSPPDNAIHLLLLDPKLASEVSDLFKRAFGKDLIVLRAGGSSFPLYVGTKPELRLGQDELSKEFVEALLKQAVPLHEQGDGMRSFVTVMMNILVSDHHSAQFLDEPEAFLHPPQARLLGEFIGKHRRSNSQLFVSTHSAEILYGLLASAQKRTRIVRIQRSGNINKVKELSSERTESLSRDTLIRYSGLLGGIFHKHVLIAEADSDCMFYSAILNSKAVSGDKEPDVLFVHGSGKHRLAKMAETLKDLDVPVSVIIDIDILNDEQTFRRLFEAVGGVWTKISSPWASLKKAIEEVRPVLNATQISAMITAALEGVDGNKAFPKAAEIKIKNILKSKSAWDDVKRAGRKGLPPGGATKHFDSIVATCASTGLWIVPEGELEGFCRSIEASHGPSFVEAVLLQRDIEQDEELSEARQFVRRVWESMPEAQSTPTLVPIAEVDVA